jgi:hypothetical protein
MNRTEASRGELEENPGEKDTWIKRDARTLEQLEGQAGAGVNSSVEHRKH